MFGKKLVQDQLEWLIKKTYDLSFAGSLFSWDDLCSKGSILFLWWEALKNR